MANEFSVKKVQLTDQKKQVVVTLGIALPPSSARVRGAHEITVKDAFVSILNQTFDKKRMELIVVHDGSSEKTLSIINEIISKDELKVIMHSTTGDRITVARQKIVENAHGNFIVFIDSDMVLPEDFIQNQFEAINKDPSIGVIGANMKGRLRNSVVAKLEGMAQSRDYEFGVIRDWRKNPKKLGTGGSIFRLAAIKKVGGFDLEIRGAGEDSDITTRIKSAGYLLILGQAEYEHEFKQNLKSLWNQLVWYGYGSHYCYHKNKDLTDLIYTYFFPFSFAGGVIRATLSFLATHQKISFLLPFYNLFKATAWWFGFFKANMDGYKPSICASVVNY